MLFVATEENYIYALDANHLTNTPVWGRGLNKFGVPETSVFYTNLPGACATIYPEVGITGTPVIDLGSSSTFPNVIYAVSKHYNITTGSITQRLNALNIQDGSFAAASLDIPAAFTGMSLPFNAAVENQRAALALAYDSSNNPLIYVAWGSHCDTNSATANYNGEAAVFTLKNQSGVATLSLVAAYTVEPTAVTSPYQSGIWMGGAGPAIDDVGTSPSNDVFLSSGNGPVSYGTSPFGSSDLGESLIRLNFSQSAPSLTAVGAYTPPQWPVLNDGSGNPTGCISTRLLILPTDGGHYSSGEKYCTMMDLDFDAGGVILARPTNVANLNSLGFVPLAGGKEGITYVVDPTQMASNTTPDTTTTAACSTPFVIQCFASVAVPGAGNILTQQADTTGSRCSPAFWNGHSMRDYMYLAGSTDTSAWAYQMTSSGGGAFKTSYLGQYDFTGNGYVVNPYPGGCPVVTWDQPGASPDSNAILWVVRRLDTMTPSIAAIFAFQAIPNSTLQLVPLGSDTTNGPPYVQFSEPTIADGHIFMAGQVLVSGSQCSTVMMCNGEVVSWH
jgi:hypothetical protein